jgi:hypothetical protein
MIERKEGVEIFNSLNKLATKVELKDLKKVWISEDSLIEKLNEDYKYSKRHLKEVQFYIEELLKELKEVKKNEK